MNSGYLPIFFAKIQEFRKTDFVASTAMLMRGNISAQLILLGVAPILTRLFSPDAFGIFALYTAFVGVISRVGSLCYERTIVLPKDDQKALYSVILSLVILIIISSISELIFLFYGNFISQQLEASTLIYWLYLAPLGILLTGLVNIFRNWTLRHSNYKTLSRAYLLESIISSIIKIGFGIILGEWVGGLVFGMLAGSVISLIILTNGFSRNGVMLINFKPIMPELIETAKFYKSFPLFASWNALFNIVSLNITIFFLTALYGPLVVGLYGLSSRIMLQPVIMISRAISNVYFQKSAQQIANKTPTLSGLKKTTNMLIIIGIIPFSIIMLTGQQIFSFVFGSQWEVAGLYAQILSPWFFLLFISGPANIVYEIYHKQKIKLLLNGATAISSISIFFLFTWITLPETIFLLAISGVNIVTGIISIITAISISRNCK